MLSIACSFLRYFCIFSSQCEARDRYEQRELAVHGTHARESKKRQGFPVALDAPSAERRVLQDPNESRMFEHEQETVRQEGAAEFFCPDPVVEVLFTDSFRGGNGTQVGSGPGAPRRNRNLQRSACAVFFRAR